MGNPSFETRQPGRLPYTRNPQNDTLYSNIGPTEFSPTL